MSRVLNFAIAVWTIAGVVGLIAIASLIGQAIKAGHAPTTRQRVRPHTPDEVRELRRWALDIDLDDEDGAS